MGGWERGDDLRFTAWEEKQVGFQWKAGGIGVPDTCTMASILIVAALSSLIGAAHSLLFEEGFALLSSLPEEGHR